MKLEYVSRLVKFESPLERFLKENEQIAGIALGAATDRFALSIHEYKVLPRMRTDFNEDN